MYADIVGSAEIADMLTLDQRSEMVDRLYGRFDQCAVEHDVFKVETFGDAYMCVTNLAKDQDSDHVVRITEFAVDAIQAASETLINLNDTSMGYIQIRIGVHSGPVISQVVGSSQRPTLGIFGDTVSTAARLAFPGRVQCSERSAVLLNEQCSKLNVAPRGKITIPGVGPMITYFVGP